MQSRQKQLARLEREERLGNLQIELSNNKSLRLSQLRQFARVVSRFCRASVAAGGRAHAGAAPVHAQ